MWEQGRQNSGYFKWKLFAFARFDAWLLKYPEGSRIPPHIDKIPKGTMYRLNIIIKKPKLGGNFYCPETVINTKRIKLFKASKYIHSCSRIIKGERLILSFGLII